jgi:hypothetical protein
MVHQSPRRNCSKISNLFALNLFFFYRSFTIPNDNECCICMDRQPNLVLPCTHKFCDECFQQWFVSFLEEKKFPVKSSCCLGLLKPRQRHPKHVHCVVKISTVIVDFYLPKHLNMIMLKRCLPNRFYHYPLIIKLVAMIVHQ